MHFSTWNIDASQILSRRVLVVMGRQVLLAPGLRMSRPIAKPVIAHRLAIRVAESHNDIPVQPLLLNISQTANFVPEGGNRWPPLTREAIYRLADQIRGQMELAW
jgi:hypothetical protein